MDFLKKEEILDYIGILNIIENLHIKNELTDKEYDYAKVLLKQEFGVFYN